MSDKRGCMCCDGDGWMHIFHLETGGWSTLKCPECDGTGIDHDPENDQ